MATSSRFGLLVRQFSTSTLRYNLSKAPIQVFGIEGRYAHALYSAASKKNQLNSVEKELKQFQELMASDAKLASFVVNPTIRRSEKRAALEQIMSKQNFSPVTINLFTAMAENGRLNKVNSILNAFGKIMSAERGELVCSVTTAKPLEAVHLKELKAALGLFVKQGESVVLETKVDPTIIGGMIVNIGDKFVDMSMSSKMKTYTNLIQQAI